MSYVSSSRMPHAYADPAPKIDDDVSEIVQDKIGAARDVVSGVSRGAWALGALGMGAIGAVLYAAFRPGAPAPRKRRASTRKPATQRTKTAS